MEPTYNSAVYGELKRIAARLMQSERFGHTLQPTALVHEAYLKLASRDMDQLDRREVIRRATRAMREVLIDHARSRGRVKRRGTKISIEAAHGAPLGDGRDILDLDRAVAKLGASYPHLREVLELRYFGGYTVVEIAEAFSVSDRTIRSQCRFGEAWVRRQLGLDPPSP